MIYYALRCADCNDVCRPVLATSESELLYPSEDQGSAHLAELVRRFHEGHSGHRLETVEAERIDWAALPRRPTGSVMLE